ncbi:conserved hypothetical protein [Petrotoga mobilis SJ95]|uniref:Uncharacterized protein n=2 Tax=Petrotoga TaxID=28236 RepID=A9BFI1_PETMO|nr:MULTISPECIES: DNA double-strand break repair nuclease NurA [Petrotoga]ABX31151.1 conserved hypothetical protein [Petrotoga mobilis SJ95]POZ93217.1 hypothetical protein AA81_02975 [Petrotoga halophila DSM 16923]
MSYGNEYSNKPFEKASKIGHTNIINDPEVKEFLSQCRIPPFKDDVDGEDIKSAFLEDIRDNPIKNIITIDGGYTNVVVKEEFPSSTIAFFQFGALFFKYNDLINLKEKPFIDPDDFSKLQNIQRIKLVLPTKGLTLKGEKDLIISVRRSVYDFFMKNPDNQGFIKALKWLLFEEYDVHSNSTWHLASCPYCGNGFDIPKASLKPNFTVNCPHCDGIVFLTDVFRLHEVIDNELGAGGVLGYLSTTIEQLIIVYLIQQILNIRPNILKETIFIKDGPLAFFGQTANIHKPMRKLISFLNSKYAIYLVGLEKSGSFVEHASQISQKLRKNQIVLLGNKYIYKYIIPGYENEDAAYGRSTYYGHKLIFKSKFDNIYIATIPSLEAKPEPQKNDYLNIDVVLHNVSALKCDLYFNSLVPIVMANKLVSLADHPSADLLKSFAQEHVL